MKTVLGNLKKRGFDPYFVENEDEAIKLIDNLIPNSASVGFGGSLTVKQLNLVDSLVGRTLYTRDKSFGKSDEEIYKLSQSADWFVCSTNALCKTGDLVNIDGRANRVSSMIFGPKDVLIVCGVNKIVEDIAEGIDRTRNVASPPNCVRLNKKTPCATTGKCSYCNSPDTICKATVILHHPTTEKNVHIVIINKTLGY